MDIIHLLPDSVANQIAAGEVVQRPASVLKELVENSLDAGATEVQMIVQDAGSTLLQVIDNGKGMSETDAHMAFERHATSKIQKADDLFDLHTMGFRGEALASIVAVAQVELRTRRPEDELGTRLEMAGSEVVRQEVVQCDAGTSIAVKNLFFNTPARRRFLKSQATELKNLLSDFYRIVLVNPQCQFRLLSDGELLFDLPIQTTKQRIDTLFSKISKKGFAQQLLTVEVETPLCTIRGYVGSPEEARKGAFQYFFVNQRYMRHPYFHKAVMQAYQGLLRPEVQPNYFLYFEMDPRQIDVNIHPTKTEIKFADEQAIWPILHAAVKETLGKYNLPSSIDFDEEQAFDIPPLSGQQLSQLRPPQTNFNPSYNPFSSPAAAPTKNWETLYQGFDQERSYQSSLGSPSPASPATSAALPAWDAAAPVLQWERRYLVVCTDQGLLLLDQHRAHVRVLYEQYLQQLREQKAPSQQMLFPETWDLGPDDMALLSTLLPDLSSIGFDLVCFGTDTYQVKGIPADLTAGEALQTLQDILQAVRQATTGDLRTQQREKTALTLAQHAAVPSGRDMSLEERQHLLEKFKGIGMPRLTPDARRIWYLVTLDEVTHWI